LEKVENNGIQHQSQVTVSECITWEISS